MNKIEISGNIVRDTEMSMVKGKTGDVALKRFTVAVNRKYKAAEGQQAADYIPCVVFGKTAEFCQKYFTKGTSVLVVGRLQTGSYTNKDGQKIYTMEVMVEEVEFGHGSPRGGNAGKDEEASAPALGEKPVPSYQEFMDIPEEEDGLPFN